ncbi:hypothetical protein RFI_16569, partial [Reticulomyxa filosa]
RLREFWQCDFDIVRTVMPTNAKDLLWDDMEVLALISQTLMDLNVQRFIIKLNHRKLLDVIFDICGVKREHVRSISSAIDKLDKRSWEEVRQEMIEKGVSLECANQLYSFVQIKGKAENCSHYPDQPHAVAQILDELERVVKLLHAYHGDIYVDRLHLDLSMVRGLDYYTGLIFEACVESDANANANANADDNTSEAIGSIAAGGRYDKLIQDFVPSQQFPCIGASIGFERIFHYLLEERKKKNGGVTMFSNAPLMQILVCEVSGKSSVDDVLYLERLKLLEELKLHHGMHCETMNKFKPSFRDQISYAEDRNIKWLVILGEEELSQNIVNLRRLTLVGDRVLISSKNSEINGHTAVITVIEPTEKAPFFYVTPDDPALLHKSKSPRSKHASPQAWKITKNEIAHVIEQNQEQTVSKLQTTGLPRGQLIDFLKHRLQL